MRKIKKSLKPSIDLRPFYLLQKHLKHSLELLVQLSLVYTAYKLINNLTALEEQYCWYVTDTEVRNKVLAILCITLADNDLTIILLSKFANDWRNHLTRTTPCSPEVNNQRKLTILKFLEILVCYNYFHSLI